MPLDLLTQSVEKDVYTTQRWSMSPSKGARPWKRSFPVSRWDSSGSEIGESLDHIFQLIEESKELLNFCDPEDDSFTSITNETLNRAHKFLFLCASEMLNKHSISIPAPRILPGPDGSIDLHWKTQNKELLVNIPTAPEAAANFYGDNYGQLFVKGTIQSNASQVAAIMMWLVTP